MSPQKKKVVRVVYENLRFQNGSSSSNNNYDGRRYMPYVFTEQGIAMLSNREIFARLDRVELKQLETDKKLEEVFNYISTNTKVKQNIFFDEQIYDAFSFIVGLIQKAKKEIILIDNYVDINQYLKRYSKFNAQKTTTDFHNASIKDAGKKSFGITKIEDKDLVKSLVNKVG
ncbi:ORF6N domain-containing protein [uncultured Sneathia sp.]|uniref:ORF6N domain-containing protein n=1 Tax=uncultured Sneathia sp. TaxID=278067 RepID=UPI002803B009|nr:ORF6N domain-containing protein [uncultured Sneathia sp.]